jgi:hypothetical protein
MTLAEELELLLLRKCSSRCLDDEEDRKAVAQTIADYLQEEDHEAEELSSGPGGSG